MTDSPKKHRADRPAKAPRRAERAHAFQVLYGLSFTQILSEETLANAFSRSPDQHEIRALTIANPEGFAWELVQGVWAQQKTLDEHLASFSQNWRIERMGKVEITLLRLALYEILFRADVPPKVAINEAIELSKQFGDDASRSFVNGILDAAAKALENGSLKRQG